MKNLTPLFILMILVFSGCSTESLEDQGQLTNFDAKIKSDIAPQEDDGVSFSYDAPVCAGTEVNYCISFPQATAGPNNKDTNVKSDLLVIGDDPTTDKVEDQYYMELLHTHAGTEACFSYTFEDAGTYTIRYKTEGSWIYKDITVENCGCEESFSYDNAGDEDPTTFTFYYTPGESISDALLTFTFPQSVTTSGLSDWTNNGNGNSQVWQTTMNLEVCNTMIWNVSLDAPCNPSGKAILWTDFKVGESSKKEAFNLENIQKTCN